MTMREDMFKVIVERPRRGGTWQGDGRAWRNSEERGGKVGMKRGYHWHKSLNENLAPLKRWLHKQIHRPWDKVFSELSAGVDKRNTVQAHIFAHIDQFVKRQAQVIDGEVHVRQHWPQRGWVPVREDSWTELFVHPATGILLPNRGQHRARRQYRKDAKARHAAVNQAASGSDINKIGS
jgi:hypothetical protein